MPDDDVGGRLKAAARAHAQSADAGTHGGTSTDAVALAPLAYAANAVTSQVELSLAFRRDAPVSESRDVLAAAAALADFVDAARPSAGDEVAVAQAISALSRLALRSSAPSRATLEVLAAGIAGRARAKGMAVPTDIPRSDVVANSAPSDRLVLIERAVAARVGTVIDAIADTSDRHRMAERLASESRVLVPLLHEARSLAPALAHDKDALAASVGHANAISEQIELLFVRARDARIGQAAAQLDEVFEAEDAMRIGVGLAATHRRAGFYGDRNVTDMDDRPGDDRSAKSGAALIDQILAWFSNQPLRQLAGIRDVSDILQEPVLHRDVSALEAFITTAVQSFVGLLPGYVGNVLGKAVSGLAANPHLFDGALSDNPLAGAGAAAVRGLGKVPVVPGLFKHGVEIAGFNAGDQRALAAIWKAAHSLPLPKALSPSARAAHAVDGAVDSIGGHDGGGANGPLVTAFMLQLTDELHRYLNTVASQAWDLRRALELVPPAGLQAMLDGLTDNAKSNAANVRGDLIERWTTLVADASVGVNEYGTIAREGTLQQISELPGVVQVSLQVTPAAGSPLIHAQSVRLNGMTVTGLKTLRSLDRPLADIPMHRVFEVAVMDRDGFEHNAGRFDLGPDGFMHLGSVRSWQLLAQVADGAQPDERGSIWTLADGIDGGGIERAERGARLIVANCGLTTRHIGGS